MLNTIYAVVGHRDESDYYYEWTVCFYATEKAAKKHAEEAKKAAKLGGHSIWDDYSEAEFAWGYEVRVINKGHLFDE